MQELIGINSSPFMRKSVFDELFDEFFGKNGFWAEEKKTSYPTNIVRMKKKNGETVALRIEYALAGFSRDEIKVEVKDNVLTIVAERKSNSSGEDDGLEEKVEYNGISYKRLSSSYQLMNSADKKNIKSRFENGLLSVTIPMVKREDNSTTIEIE